MISEKWKLNLNIEKLSEHLLNNVFNKQITEQSEAFGGWSVLSSNGDYTDGWAMGHKQYIASESEEVRARAKQEAKKSTDYFLETEICTGYLKEVIDTIKSHNLNPCRARIIRLTAGGLSSWHVDAPPNIYAVRLHVPIITNSGCYFETRHEREHLVADGSAYFLFVNREHRVVNNGTLPRYHLVMNIFDNNRVSQHHRVEDFNGF